jgi:hypothetical protein
MKNNQTELSLEALALLTNLETELSAHQALTREDRELERLARREAQREARLAYGA